MLQLPVLTNGDNSSVRHDIRSGHSDALMITGDGFGNGRNFGYNSNLLVGAPTWNGDGTGVSEESRGGRWGAFPEVDPPWLIVGGPYVVVGNFMRREDVNLSISATLKFLVGSSCP